jgi:glyoxylase-like metal-dependent hydrolase (beta-lactamase superfamily II)
MPTFEYTIGEVRISAVFDWVGEVPHARRLLPGTTRSDWKRHQQLLTEGLWDPITDSRTVTVFSWIVRTGGLTVVIDTGAGNDKDRPGSPLFHQLHTEYLDNLAHAGVRPQEVDVVVNTHLHADHVGWNTRHTDGGWVPTFPNARYVLPQPDVEFWDPQRGRVSRLGEANSNVFTDSVQPVLDSGQADIWADSYRVGPGITALAAPGHTPGSSLLTVDCGPETALFVGDLLHSPLQVVNPDWASCFDEDQEQANATRRRVLAQARQSNTVVLPAHLPNARVLRFVADGEEFLIHDWREPEDTDDAE